MKTDITINNEIVYKRLTIYHDKTYKIYIHQNNVTSSISNSSVPAKLDTEALIRSILRFIEKMHICPGFVQENSINDVSNLSHECYNQEGYIDSTRYRSNNCHYVSKTMAPTARWTEKCKECEKEKNKLRCKLKRKRKRDKNPKGINEKFINCALRDNDTNLKLLKIKQQQHRIATRSATYHKQKHKILKNKLVELSDADHRDLRSIVAHIKTQNADINLYPNDEKKQIMLEQQLLHTNEKNNKWEPQLIEFCLQIWHRSKGAYADIHGSGFLTLPSGRHLRLISNRNRQKPGVNSGTLAHMKASAVARELPPHGYTGILLFDEMMIQGSLEMVRKGSQYQLCGLVDQGQFHKDMVNLQKGSDILETASHILQFKFLSIEKFVYPVAWWPTKNVDPESLFTHHWDCVSGLLEYGFSTRGSLCDGGQANRDFIKAHFKNEDDVIECQFTTKNLYTGEDFVFIMDPSHLFKKIRNGVSKSYVTNSPRRYEIDGKMILWSHFKEAYTFDKSSTAIATNRRLTDTHFNPSSKEKMRNHLAYEVLDKDMLYLMQLYSKSTSEVEMTVEFLKQTSLLLKNFLSPSPILTKSDVRLAENDAILQWFTMWKEKTAGLTKYTPKERAKAFLPDKTFFDLQSYVLGFKRYCHMIIDTHNGAGAIPKQTNQDRLENLFGIIRAANGQNNNPTVAGYGPSLNAAVQMGEYRCKRGNAS
ncbi:unnamed protein product [Owenia fusiformis]|uniref:Uncharacterized protein n=1 Tax=Owenia fusiformis TaxID=6347 RepID=A0A8J1TBS3_OWEFU|nr:unnamed protein product [Owenia fusiformis]